MVSQNPMSIAKYCHVTPVNMTTTVNDDKQFISINFEHKYQR